MSTVGKRRVEYRDLAEALAKEKLGAATVKVSPFGGVYEAEGGAYVEIQLWVPEECLAKSSETNSQG